MNEKKHWDKIAATYEEEIFDVFASDRNGVLRKYFDKYGNRDHHAIDFGCGTGKALPFLAPLFLRVVGTDISSQCLKTAQARKFANVSFRQADLSRKGLKFQPADFAFCCNVVMLPEIEKDEQMLRNIQLSLKHGGTAVFVLPSTESILYASSRMMEWYRKERTASKDVPNSEFDYYKGSKRNLAQGIFSINGVPTKHYLESEIKVMFANAGFSVRAIEKIEYGWDTEFAEPPGWMADPLPWDWLVDAGKP